MTQQRGSSSGTERRPHKPEAGGSSPPLAIVPTGRCDFCYAERPTWLYRCESFESAPGIGWESDGDWAACDECHVRIERRDVDAMLDHRDLSAEMEVARLVPGLSYEEVKRDMREMVRRLYLAFFRYRTGPAMKVAGDGARAAR